MTHYKERHKKMNSLYDFAFGLNESIGEKSKQVQRDPVVKKENGVDISEIIDASLFEKKFSEV